MTHPLTRLSLLLALAWLSGCTAYGTARTVTLGDVPVASSYWRTEDSTGEPLFVETTAALVAKRQLKTAIRVEPSLEDHLRRELEAALGARLERLELLDVGYQYAYYFPSREDDFVLRVELEAPAAGRRGEFEGRVRGRESVGDLLSLEQGWKEQIPDTGAGRGEPEKVRKLERRADQQAWIQRGLLLEATRRLVAAVQAG